MKTKCSDIEERLGDILADALPSADLRAVLDHSDKCPRCRHLLEVAQGKMDLLPSSSGQELTGEILRKTSGLACGRVREHICDFVDGTLPRDDAQMLAVHVENCNSCAGLARTLEELNAVLPRLAEIDPGARFTREVLAATTRSERFKPEGRETRAGWWNLVMRRPRFAWEAAYVGTLLLTLVFSNPTLTSLAATVPLDGVRAKTRQVWLTANRELTGLSSTAASGAEAAAERLSQKATGDPRQATDLAARLWQKGRQWAQDLALSAFALIKGWGTRALQTLQDSWKSMGLDRTFS